VRVPKGRAITPWSGMEARAVFLVGFMASGKTTLGRELASRLHWNFLDLDENIQLREGKAIADIFSDRGEPAFRAAETAALKDAVESITHDTVIALGGGAFAQEHNRKLIGSWPSFFLQAPVDELWQRCSEDRNIRPLLQDRERFGRLHDERLPFYQLATFTVQTSGKHPTVICAAMEAALQQRFGWTKSVTHPLSQQDRTTETGGTR
jgi:shikimate kinase